MTTVSALYIYPIEPCRGIEVQGFRFDELGPQLDRRYMLVGSDGKFISLQDAPRLADVVPSLLPTAIALRAPQLPQFKLPLSLGDGARVMEVEIGKHRGPAMVAGGDAGDWFSDLLQRACTLVWMPRGPLRRVDPAYSSEDAYTAFTDGFPVSLVAAASVSALAARARGVTAERFRPNIVVEGGEAYAEDAWKRIKIGEVPFDVVKGSVVFRGEPPAADAALTALASDRKHGDELVFGRSCIHRELGMVRVGDAVEVLTTS
jgi:uncharacterized protein YcbX